MPYEKYEAWKTAHELALLVYRVTDDWPACERYQLTAQLRRAVLSVPTNIAEGAVKRGPREFRRYLDIARGSLSEVSYLLQFSKDRGILNEESFQVIYSLRDRVGKLTWGLYSSLKKSASGVLGFLICPPVPPAYHFRVSIRPAVHQSDRHGVFSSSFSIASSTQRRTHGRESSRCRTSAVSAWVSPCDAKVASTNDGSC